MRSRQAILFFSPAGRSVPDFVTAWVNGRGLPVITVPQAAGVEERVLRALPTLVVVDADSGEEGMQLCARLKGDAYTAIVPLAVVTERHATDAVRRWFAAGADEVITPMFEPGEQAGRLEALVTRAERDVAVNPSTRLPGTTEIERAVRRRMDLGEFFAVCYADLDHFKEYNDRYSYNDGDPYQYNEQDRRAGYYFGKDRRGQLHRVPLMTLSIGVVTNQHRRFTHTAQVSELATEMKSYAKTQAGSVFVVDRRHDPEPGEEGSRTSEA